MIPFVCIHALSLGKTGIFQGTFEFVAKEVLRSVTDVDIITEFDFLPNYARFP